MPARRATWISTCCFGRQLLGALHEIVCNFYIVNHLVIVKYATIIIVPFCFWSYRKVKYLNSNSDSKISLVQSYKLVCE